VCIYDGLAISRGISRGSPNANAGNYWTVKSCANHKNIKGPDSHSVCLRDTRSDYEGRSFAALPQAFSSRSSASGWPHTDDTLPLLTSAMEEAPFETSCYMDAGVSARVAWGGLIGERALRGIVGYDEGLKRQRGRGGYGLRRQGGRSAMEPVPKKATDGYGDERWSERL
jgi:hypothetical protein